MEAALKPGADRQSGADRRPAEGAGRRRSVRHVKRPSPATSSATRGKQFREIIRQDARERSVRDTYAAMQEVPRQAPPRVNVDYPEKAALATVPPLILNRLPPLPDGIEYRFMGRDLILRDTNANLIVDFIHEAVPTIRR